MQFLQTGLERSEECPLVSTEQTPAEPEDTFEPYSFEPSHDDLTLVTVHYERGTTIGRDEDFAVRTLEGGERAVAEWFDLPLTRETSSTTARSTPRETASYSTASRDPDRSPQTGSTSGGRPTTASVCSRAASAPRRY